MLLNKEQIKNAKDLQYEEISTDEWGKGSVVRIRSWTGKDRNAMEQEWLKKDNNTTGFKEKMIVISVVDDKGDLIFTDKDVSWLSGKSAAPIDRIAIAVMRMNGLSGTDVDDAVKN